MAASLVYRRHGGSLQVDIPDFAALVEAIRIPETQWMATACPIEGLHCDAHFLALLDTDGNARIRVAELRAAVEYTARMLQSRQGVDTKSDVLELGALSAEGAPLRAAALRVLTALQSTDPGRISLEQVRASEPVMRKAGLNGDGIVEPAFLPEPVRPLATRIMASFPEVKNRAGQAGLDLAMVQRFRVERAAFLAHQATQATVQVWGEASLARAQRIREVKPLLDAYFLQCRLVAAQPDAAASLKLPVGRVEGVLGDAAALEKAAALLPIAGANPAGVLTWSRLYRGPAFEVLEAFHREVVGPTLGESETLSDAAWRKLSAQADAVLAWQAAFEASPVRAMLVEMPTVADADLDTLEAACRADLALKEELEAITGLERLILYQRWLLTFANNFISMPDLYTAKRHAIYEQGTLILGGRKYTLAVLVRAHDEHAALCTQGTTCILYVKVTPKDGAAGYEVAVPVTRGRSTGLEVGKRGIFHDVNGQEHDATVVQVIRQPVSLWEAMTMPFQRIGKFITSKVEALASSGDKAFDAQLEKGYTHSVQAAATPPAAPAVAGAAPAPAAAAPGGGLGGLVVAGGIAFAALGSALAFIVTQMRSLSLGDVLSAAITIAAIVMIPSGLLGWLKLRKRNLALLLEGSGWALNDRLMLTQELARLITRKPRLPHGATIDHQDRLRSTLEGIRGDEEEEDTEEEIPGSVKLLVALFVLFALLWQFREPLLRLACGREWLSGATCSALLPPVAPPAPAAPAAAAPAKP
jgi:hypothetical protein